MKYSNRDNKDDHKNDHTPIYSSRSTTHDYLTLRGIELRTQIKGEEVYTACLGEMLDNSIDYVEAHGVKDPQVMVMISTTPLGNEKSFVTISVRNSVNPGSNHVFSKQHLELIYNFKTYYSSKRFFRISRGVLGDASKLMLGAPYALADSMNIDLTDAGIAYPITHKTSTNGILKIQKLRNYVEQFIEGQDYQELESKIRIEVEKSVSDNKRLLQNALFSVLLALRNDPDRYLIVDKMELTPFTTTILNYNSFLGSRRSPGDEQFVERILEVAEKIYCNLQKVMINSSISSAAGLEEGLWPQNLELV